MSEEKDRAENAKAEKDSEKAGLKTPQILAAALAAVTAALLGSTMGVTGTVIGAGIASVVTTVGSELYLRSLNRTREAAARTRELARQRAAMKANRTTTVLPQARQVPGQHTVAYRGPRRTQVFQPATGGEQDVTRRLPVAGDGQSGGGERTVFIPRPGLQVPPEDVSPPEPQRRRLRWPLIAATSLLAFVIGMLVLTGFEQVTGKAISGGSGNTVSRIVGGGDGGAEQQPEPRQPAQQQEEEGQVDEQDHAAITTAPSEPAEPVDPAESNAPSSENQAEPSEPSAPSSSQEQASETPEAPSESAPASGGADDS